MMPAVIVLKVDAEVKKYLVIYVQKKERKGWICGHGCL